MVNMRKQDSCELFCNLQTISCHASSGPSPVSSTLMAVVVMMITLVKGDDQGDMPKCKINGTVHIWSILSRKGAQM